MSDHTPMASPLPIDAILAELVALASRHTRLVVEAPTGAGKTTRVPTALLGTLAPGRQIWVAEPRRLAAKLMAHRVSSELGQRLGSTVGYTVRFDDCVSQETRIRYVTSGILLRRLLADPELTGIDCVILDEFHERHIDTDLALALVCQAQSRRPELRLIVMSATLDGARISQLLGGCPRLTSEGKLYPIELEFEQQVDERPLDKRISSALRRIIEHDPRGSTLVFLPGAAEIRRTRSTIAPLCEQAQLDLFVLHGDLPLDEQTKAILPGRRPRVVLTTNVAESSVTVEGVTAVIDSGLCRQQSNSAFSGLSRLVVQRISRASATQRAGRAGRTAPGRVIRLYTKGDFDTRPEFESPEILRVDFSEALLLLAGAARRAQASGNTHAFLGELLFLDAPAPTAVEAARSLLRQLGAIDSSDLLTRTGDEMLRLPLHPRLARLLIECDSRRIGALGALVAALLAERDLRSTQQSTFGARQEHRRRLLSGDSDVLELVESYLRGRDARMSNSELRESGIDPMAFRSVQRSYEQLRRLVRHGASNVEMDDWAEEELAIALLVAFPDRVAKRRNPDGAELVLRSGATARLSDSTVVTKPQWLLAIDAEERRELGRGSTTAVRVASAIKEDWLLDVLTDDLVNEEELCWMDPPGRVELRSRIRLGSLVVEESRRPAKPGADVATMLMSVVEQSGLLKCDEVSRLLARLALYTQFQKGTATPMDWESVKTNALSQLLLTRIDLEGLDGSTLASNLLNHLPPVYAEPLRSQVPETIVLSKGRRCAVHYEVGKNPWIVSRLQDFFGLSETPTILNGRQKLVVHLLAPNQRAVQITDDLRGFWSKHYPEIRRQLQRRYPKHAWPEDGQSASPPEPRPGHRPR